MALLKNPFYYFYKKKEIEKNWVIQQQGNDK